MRREKNTNTITFFSSYFSTVAMCNGSKQAFVFPFQCIIFLFSALVLFLQIFWRLSIQLCSCFYFIFNWLIPSIHLSHIKMQLILLYLFLSLRLQNIQKYAGIFYKLFIFFASIYCCCCFRFKLHTSLFFPCNCTHHIFHFILIRFLFVCEQMIDFCHRYSVRCVCNLPLDLFCVHVVHFILFSKLFFRIVWWAVCAWANNMSICSTIWIHRKSYIKHFISFS